MASNVRMDMLLETIAQPVPGLDGTMIDSSRAMALAGPRLTVVLTGGEPLARLGLVDLVRLLAAIPGLDDLSMTSNGTLLARHAAALARAGLDRGLENGARLHVVDLRHGEPEPYPAHPQHRVEFAERLRPAGNVGDRQIERIGEIREGLR